MFYIRLQPLFALFLSARSTLCVNFTTKLCTDIVSFTGDMELLNICQVHISERKEKCRRELDTVKYTEKI